MNTEDGRKAKIAEMHKSLLDYTSMLVDRISGLETENRVLGNANERYKEGNDKIWKDSLEKNVEIKKYRSRFVIASIFLGVSLIVNWMFVLFYVL